MSPILWVGKRERGRVSTTHMSENWRPLSARETEEEAEAYRALQPGVPPWLRDSLWEWIEPQVTFFKPTGYAPGDGWREADGPLLRQLERLCRFETNWNGNDGLAGYHALREKAKSDSKLMLDIVDYLVGNPPTNHQTPSPEELDKLLEEGGSAYKVDMTVNPPMITRRVDVTIEDAAKRITEQKETPNALLRLAWNATYGLHPNASDGYRQAVRAVEAAAIPVILPNDRDATLGRVIGTLRSRSDRWRLSFTHWTKPEEPIATLISMMALLWEGQYDRHVTDGVSLHVSQEEAETALHLAVTLVQWFTTSRVSRRGED